MKTNGKIVDGVDAVDFVGHSMWPLESIRQLPRVIVTQAGDDCWFVYRVEHPFLHFSGLVWSTECEGKTYVKPLFFGYGTTEPLSELRHMYWGEDGSGYVHNFPIDKAKSLLTELDKNFRYHG